MIEAGERDLRLADVAVRGRAQCPDEAEARIQPLRPVEIMERRVEVLVQE